MKSNKRFIFTSIICVCILIQCSSKNRISDLFNHGIEKIGRKYIFDKSLVVYQVDLKNIGGKWTVSGMTSHALAYQEINIFSDSLFQKNGYKRNKQSIWGNVKEGSSRSMRDLRFRRVFFPLLPQWGIC